MALTVRDDGGQIAISLTSPDGDEATVTVDRDEARHFWGELGRLLEEPEGGF